MVDSIPRISEEFEKAETINCEVLSWCHCRSSRSFSMARDNRIDAEESLSDTVVVGKDGTSACFISW